MKPSELQELQQDDLKRAFRDVIATAAGKRVLFWVLEQCVIHGEAYTGEDCSTNYNLGRQGVGKRLIHMLDGIDPKIYPTLLLEVARMNEEQQQILKHTSEQEDSEDEA